MDESQTQKVSEFCSISGADTERAEFFLQAAGWNTELAISTFFENEGELPSEETSTETEGPTPTASRHPVEPSAPETSSGAQGMPARSQPKPSSRIQTFANWISGNQAQAEDDDDQGQAYYAGGSDTSGQQILGPPRKEPPKGGKVAEELFNAVKKHGAEVVSESDRAKRPQKAHFVGTGYRLGESESEVNHPLAGAAQKKEPDVIILRLWRTGFTLNDEPLRPFNDPQNRQFLDSVQRGEIPQELLRLAPGGEVALDMEDHSSEDYVPPKQPKVRAFTGSGQTLGSESTPQPSTSSAVAATSASPVTVDPSLPVTNIQIRLADGSRLVAKFNHTHTVGDVRRHLVASRPEYVGVAFSLITTLPSRQLTDDTVTLSEADLLNAAIMQKL